ncbi:MAG: LysM domain-containing protein, partial [Verrucomicrobiota bacterium]|nr:LysM domain-containing protein [Verrucomicrobiota bacterium]
SSPGFGKATFRPESIMRMEFQAYLARADIKTIYRVQQGDTINSIARKRGASVQAILKANPSIKPGQLRIGQHVIIPLNK